MPNPDVELRIKAYRARSRAVARQFENAMRVHGFAHTSKHLFTSMSQHWALWVALVVPSYPRRSFTVEWGLRVLNEPFPALHLNGGRYGGSDLPFITSFVDSDASESRCALDLDRIVSERALPWFAKYASNETLLHGASPLKPDAREALRESLAGVASPARLEASKKLLGRQSAA